MREPTLTPCLGNAKGTDFLARVAQTSRSQAEVMLLIISQESRAVRVRAKVCRARRQPCRSSRVSNKNELERAGKS